MGGSGSRLVRFALRAVRGRIRMRLLTARERTRNNSEHPTGDRVKGFMKSVRPVWPAAVLLLSVLTAGAQITIGTLSPGTNRPAWHFAPTNRLVLATNRPPLGHPLELGPGEMLPPGIYLSRPYTCMIRSPGRIPGETNLLDFTPSAPVVPLPNQRPDLQFFPLRPAKP